LFAQSGENFQSDRSIALFIVLRGGRFGRESLDKLGSTYDTHELAIWQDLIRFRSNNIANSHSGVFSLAVTTFSDINSDTFRPWDLA
jgi:hypothetical protein